MRRPNAKSDNFVFGIGALSTLVLVAASAFGMGQPPQSPIVGAHGQVVMGGDQPWITRSRVVDFELDVLRTFVDRAEDEPTIHLPLFDDLEVSFKVSSAEMTSPERFTLEGAVPRMLGSFGLVTVHDSVVSGYISLPRIGEITLQSAPGGRVRITQVDPSLKPTCGVDHNQPGVKLNGVKRGEGVPQPISAGTIVVSLYAVVTPEAVADVGSFQQIVADLETSVAITNTVLANSELDVVVKLLLVNQVNYLECGNDPELDPIHPDCMALDLGFLQSGAPPFDGVHQTRSTLCADLVVLVVAYAPNTGEPAGIAFLMQEPSATQFGNGFSVVRSDSLLGTTVAHELGHNFGCAHDHAQGGAGIFSYSHGHRFYGQSSTLTDPLYITVMSYAPGQTLALFSNPNIFFDGVACGIPATLPFAADNSLTISETSPHVATYGDQICLTGVVHGVSPGQSIQDAIDAAQNGDQVVVANGTYEEVIDFKGKQILLRSQNGPGSTFIDGVNDAGLSVVTFKSGEGPMTVMDGFTIRNGFTVRGGGLLIRDSSPTIVNCRFVDNEALIAGGGAFVENGWPSFLGCEFTDNVSQADGGGMYVDEGGPRVNACVFQGNTAGMISGTGYGGAIASWESEMELRVSIVGYSDPDTPNAGERNMAATAGGGMYVFNSSPNPNDWILPVVGSSQICGNVPNNLAQPYIDDEANTICALDFDITVPGDYPTIQAAIDVAGDGDSIVVSPGTYEENIDLLGKSIHLQSFDPSDPAIVAATIIDGTGSGSTVKCASGETTNTIIDGFTITGGSALHGGGIRIQSSSPIIDRCVITGNNATSGGGIYVSDGAGTIRNTTIESNTATNSGGGIAIQNSNALQMNNVLIQANHTDHIGGGMVTQASNQTMIDITVIGNTADQWGGGVYNGTLGFPVFINASITNNTAVLGGGVYTGPNSMTGLSQSTVCSNVPANFEGPWGDLGGNSVSDICPPLNNSPENASPINKSISTIVGSFTGATRDGAASCDPDGVDVFYSYIVVGGPVTLSLDTCGSGGDAAIAVFDADGTELACSTNCAGGACPGQDACVTIPSLSDGEYLIRVSKVPSLVAGIGADEFVLNYHESLPGHDLNGDGAVDVADLLILLGSWGPCSSCPADFTSDGAVDVADLLELLANWG